MASSLNLLPSREYLQLWRSLQFGNNLGDWLEKNISIKKVKTSNENVNLVCADVVSGIFINKLRSVRGGNTR